MMRDRKIKVSCLALGCLSVVFGFITGLPAIIVGHVALVRGRRCNDRSPLVVIGLSLGYVFTVASVVLLWIISQNRYLDEARVNSNLNEGRGLVIALDLYEDRNGRVPVSLDELISSGLANLKMKTYDGVDRKIEWGYYPKSSGSSGQEIVIAGPIEEEAGYRVVVWSSGNAEMLPERDAQRQARLQKLTLP